MEKMKKMPIILVLGIAIPMLLFSCAGMKKHPVEEEALQAPAEAEETPGKALLAVTHEAAGISCSDCHEEDPPASAVAAATCLTCHENYREVAASYLDPHNAHIDYANCSDCHHVHRESEMICQGCHHTFNIQAP